ncbi:hypothetical protein [Cognatiyoonia sp. IB215182]|uniref:hypothetical protein n=1 Tax=Cognatiyoonia sp. IB215182 TaxID=3097353 RepID=UPI002A15A874|nr:hypothetical protein [Cognatiyoonia sp. IB215182]MDX8353731.1 hypothetical protein [Cognatiyoonia sp. IB215182]
MTNPREAIFVLLTVIGLGALVYFFTAPADPEETFRFAADGNTLIGTEFDARENLGGFVVSASVGMYANRAGWTELNPGRARDICGALLTRAGWAMSDVFERDDVYRIEFTVNPDGFGRDRDLRNDVYFAVAVRNGSCIEPRSSRLSGLSMPGKLRDWDMVSVQYRQDKSVAEVTFDQANGVTYTDVIDAFDPVLACAAALAETFPTTVTPLERGDLDQMHVVARNKRGNALLHFYTSKSWMLSIAGSVCLLDEGVEG